MEIFDIITYPILAAVLFLIAQIYIKIARRYHIVDNPNHRSSHTQTTIRGGGILFYIAIVLSFATTGFSNPLFFISVSLLALISFIDDIRGLSSIQRLFFQIVAISMILYETTLFEINISVLIPVLVLSIGFLNIYNFMDGINGITGFNSLVVLFGFLYLNSIHQLVPQNLVAFTIVSIMVFGFYNFRKKAVFFSGDIGSITLGILIVFLSSIFIHSLMAPSIFLFCCVYAIDGGLTIMRRLLKKENIFKPHKTHLYQIITQKTALTHIQTAALFALVQSLFIVIALVTIELPFLDQLIIVLLCLLVLIICYFYIMRRINPKN